MPRMTLARHREDAGVENGRIELRQMEHDREENERDGMVAQALDAVRCNVMLMERRIEARQTALLGAAAMPRHEERAGHYSSDTSDSEQQDETGL